jgi:hypothetical protein
MYLGRDCPPPTTMRFGGAVSFAKMSSFELRWAGSDKFDHESIAITAVFDELPQPDERVALREALLAWSERADTNGFGDWEGYDGPYFSGAEAEMRPVAEWTFDGSHGDVDRAFDTMTGWLEHYNKSAAEPIRYLVVGFWDPEENLPPARLPQ